MSVEHFNLPYILYDDGSVYNHQNQPVLVRHHATGFTMQVVQFQQQSAVVVPHAVHDADTEDSDDEHDDADDFYAQTLEDNTSIGQNSVGQDNDNDYNDSDDYFESDETEQDPTDLTAESDDGFGTCTDNNGDDDEFASVGTQKDSIDLTAGSEVEDEQDDFVVPAGFRRRVGGKSTWPGCTRPFYPAMIVEPITDAESDNEDNEVAIQDPDIIVQGHLGSMSPLNKSTLESEVSAGGNGLGQSISTSPSDVTQAPAISTPYKPARKCPAEAYQSSSTSNAAQAVVTPIPTPTPYKPARKGPARTCPTSIQNSKVTKKRSFSDSEDSGSGDADDEDFEDDAQPSPPKRVKVFNKASGSMTKRATSKQNRSNAVRRAPRVSQTTASRSRTARPGTGTGSGRRNGPWIQAEKDAIEQIIREQRHYESLRGTTRALYDMRLFAMCSREMTSRFNFNRSPVACKNYWCRFGREKTGFDERSNAARIQRPLTTSAQGPKKGSAPKVRKPKAKKIVDESEDEEEHDDVLGEDEDDDGEVYGDEDEVEDDEVYYDDEDEFEEVDDDDDNDEGGFAGGFGGGQSMNLGGFPPDMMMDAYED